MAQRELHTLDGMRGVAALAVVVLHAEIMPGGPAHIMPSAYLAVDLFFALSGFVLQHAYAERLAGALTPFGFLKARYIRLYPLFVLGAILGSLSAAVAVVLGAGELTAGSLAVAVATALLMLPSPTWGVTSVLFPVNIPGWSIAYELLVNLGFAAVFRWLTRPVLIALVAVAGGLLAWAVFVAGHVDFGSTWATAPQGVVRITFSFFAGVLGRRLYDRPARASWAAWLIPIVLIPLFALSPLGPLRAWVDLVAVLAFPLLIVAGAAFEPGPVGVRIFRFLGLISFPIYAVHYPVLELLRRALRMVHLEQAYAPAALVTIVGLMAVCAVLARHFDPPARRALTAALNRSYRANGSVLPGP